MIKSSPRFSASTSVSRWSTVVVWAGVLLVVACSEPSVEPPEPTKTVMASAECLDCNVLLLSIDTLRPDHLGTYGYFRDTDPTLRSLAAEGVVVERALHNGGGTLTSHMSLMTSMGRFTHGMEAGSEEPLPGAAVTLAELLSDAGYRTAAFTDGGWMRAKFGFDQGFDVYDDAGGHLDSIIPKALEWLDEESADPFFLFLHTYDVHSKPGPLPYDCPAEFRDRFLSGKGEPFDGCKDGRCGTRMLAWINDEITAGRLDGRDYLSPAELRTIVDLYDGCISYADHQVAGLLAALQERGMLSNTILVVVSDHGEEFLEHGMLLHARGGYDSIARIPLILRWPDRRFAGKRVESLVAMIDLAPSILEILGVTSDPGMQGRSFIPAVVGDRPTRTMVSMGIASSREKWKYILTSEQLFDLDADPDEQVDVAGSQEALRVEMSSELRRSVAEDRRQGKALRGQSSPTASARLTPDEEAQLRALGYLGGN